MTVTRKKVTGIICPKCDQFVWSRHRHDYRACECGYCTVDGGQADYVRIGWGRSSKTGYSWPVHERVVPMRTEMEVVLTQDDQDLLSYNSRFPY